MHAFISNKICVKGARRSPITYMRWCFDGNDKWLMPKYKQLFVYLIICYMWAILCTLSNDFWCEQSSKWDKKKKFYFLFIFVRRVVLPMMHHQIHIILVSRAYSITTFSPHRGEIRVDGNTNLIIIFMLFIVKTIEKLYFQNHSLYTKYPRFQNIPQYSRVFYECFLGCSWLCQTILDSGMFQNALDCSGLFWKFLDG